MKNWQTFFALSILALIFAAVLTPAIAPLQDMRFVFLWPIAFGGIGAILAFVRVWKTNLNSSWIARLFGSSLLGLGAWIMGWIVALMIFLLLNVALDHSLSRQRVMQIEKREIRNSRGSDSYHLLCRDIKDGKDGDLKVERALFRQKSIGERVIVTTRAGGLGVERVERVE